MGSDVALASNATLAQYSNLFVYSAMTVFVVAFVLFAITMAKRSEITNVSVADADLKVPAGAAVGVAGGSDSINSKVNTRAPEYVRDAGPERARRLGNIAFSLTWLATGLLGAGIIARGLSAGRPPFGNMYEYSLMIAFVASLIFLVLSTKTDVRWLGVLITGAVLLILGVAVAILYTESAPLVPALKSYWLVIHVVSIIVASGAFTVGAMVTIMYLIRERAETNAKAGQGSLESGLAARLPSAERLDALSYRIYAFTFPLWTFAVIAGAIWAEAAWGRFWGWDPKETWAFITWVVFAGYLHARATAGWSGRKAAIIALIGFATIIFNYFFVNFVASGLHSYAGV